VNNVFRFAAIITADRGAHFSPVFRGPYLLRAIAIRLMMASLSPVPSAVGLAEHLPAPLPIDHPALAPSVAGRPAVF